MKMHRLAVAALTTLLAAGVAAPAFAAGDPGHDRGRHGWHDNGRGHGPGKHAGRGHYNEGYRQGYRDAHRGPPPRVVYRPYAFERGHGYRNYYGGPVYVVSDYGRYHVRRPPRGHQWIRDDRGNLLMVAIATGIIADIVLHH